MRQKTSSADVFAAIAEPKRRELIVVLSDGAEHAVNDLVLRMRIAQPSVSKHLGALRKAGIVAVHKRGQHRLYRLKPEALKPVHDWVKDFERYWTHQIDQVKERAERKALERLIRITETPHHTEET